MALWIQLPTESRALAQQLQLLASRRVDGKVALRRGALASPQFERTRFLVPPIDEQVRLAVDMREHWKASGSASSN
jgi:hypothetical protein